MHVCTPVSPVSNRFTNRHVRTCNTSRYEINQLCVPTPHQTVHFNVCICTYVVMCDIICLVGYRLLCHQNERICWPPNSHQQSAHICEYRSDPTQSSSVQIEHLLTRHTNLLPVDHPVVVKPLLLLGGQPLRTLCHYLNYQSHCHRIHRKTMEHLFLTRC